MRVTDQDFTDSLSVAPQKVYGIQSVLSKTEIDSYDPSVEKGVNVLKTFLKRYPLFYEFIWKVFSPGVSLVFHTSSRRAFHLYFPKDDTTKLRVVSLGSGIRRIHPDIINADIYPFRNVDLLADARNLPFKNNSIDMFICEAVLEHVAEADRVISEISRVVRPGGHIYISVPFFYPYHASPDDFHRWTLPGIMHEFAEFKIDKSGVSAGPGAALQATLMHVCALLFSFGSYTLYHGFAIIFMFLFSPFKILDLIFGIIPNASDVGAVVYIMGTKK
jgi:SAM-dependent methyltransferase